MVNLYCLEVALFYICEDKGKCWILPIWASRGSVLYQCFRDRCIDRSRKCAPISPSALCHFLSGFSALLLGDYAVLLVFG